LDTNFVFAYFNLGCTYSLLKLVDQAFYTLEISLKKGYKDYDVIHQDPELANLRERNEAMERFNEKIFSSYPFGE
jgi:hypothetical protein